MNQPPSNISHLSTASGYGPGHTGPRPRPEFRPDQAAGFKPKFVAKGHDAQLQEAQHGKLVTTLTLTSGVRVTGIILKRDKFTITVRHGAGDEIFYKHAIEGVLITRPASDE